MSEPPGSQRYGGPEYRRLLAAARRSLERTGGDLSGRVSVTDPSDAERKAIIGITGVHKAAGTARLTVSLATLDAAVRNGTGRSLAAVLADLSGELRDRPAETTSRAAARGVLIEIGESSRLHGSCPWYRNWLAGLKRDGSISRLAGANGTAVLEQAVAILEYLTARPPSAPPIPLPALAVRLTGNTKALSHPATLATLVLRGLALRAGTDRPISAAGRRELWDRFGVLVDDLASRVLVLNLAASGEGLGQWLTGAAAFGTPFQVTLQQLTVHPIRLKAERIFVCENPAVLRRACAELGPACPPLVCTEGRPSTAFHRLAGLALVAGSELWYHGDFDWPGVAIASDVISRYRARPWRLGCRDYLTAAERTPAAVALQGEAVATPWDEKLCPAMRATGAAIYEESVGDELIADLRM